MKGTKVATRYAKSLMELALDQNKLDQVAGDMNYLLETSENHDFELFLNNPIVKSDKKIDIYKELFGQFEDLTSNFINLITKNGREAYLPEIAQAFDSLLKEHKGIVAVTLISAVKLEDSTKKAILAKIDNYVDGTIELKEKIDASLIGGFIVKIGNKQIDASVATKLNKLKQTLMN